LICWSIAWLNVFFSHWFLPSFLPSFVHSLIHLLHIHSFVHSFIHSFVLSIYRKEGWQPKLARTQSWHRWCHSQGRTPTVIPGAGPPRPRLGRGRQIYIYMFIWISLNVNKNGVCIYIYSTREALLSEAGFEKVLRTQIWVRRRKLFCRWFGFLLGQAGCISIAAWTQLKV
jgi:hypothetical protein